MRSAHSPRGFLPNEWSQTPPFFAELSVATVVQLHALRCAFSLPPVGPKSCHRHTLSQEPESRVATRPAWTSSTWRGEFCLRGHTSHAISFRAAPPLLVADCLAGLRLPAEHQVRIDSRSPCGRDASRLSRTANGRREHRGFRGHRSGCSWRPGHRSDALPF